MNLIFAFLKHFVAVTVFEERKNCPLDTIRPANTHGHVLSSRVQEHFQVKQKTPVSYLPPDMNSWLSDLAQHLQPVGKPKCTQNGLNRIELAKYFEPSLFQVFAKPRFCKNKLHRKQRM